MLRPPLGESISAWHKQHRALCIHTKARRLPISACQRANQPRAILGVVNEAAAERIASLGRAWHTIVAVADAWRGMTSVVRYDLPRLQAPNLKHEGTGTGIQPTV